MKAKALPLMLTGLGFAIAVGCHTSAGGHGGGGNGGGTGNAAVDATLGTLEASINSGLPTIDPSITAGTITNPHQAPVSSQATVNFVGLGNDGSVASASIAFTVSYIVANGSETRTLVINEASTGFQLLSESTVLSPLSYGVRVPPEGTAGLNTATGTGQFFAILTVTQTGAVTRLFDNTSPTTNRTLVSFGSLPNPVPSTISGTLASSQDYLLEYHLSGAPPVAKLAKITAGNNSLLFQRTTTGLAQVQLTFTSVTFGGAGYPLTGDVVVPIANDIPTGISPSSAFNIQGDVGNASAITSLTIAFAGPYPGSPTTFQTSNTFAVASIFSGLTGVNNGQIDTNQPISAIAAEFENATNGLSVAHSLSPVLALMAGETMQSLLYEPETSTQTFTFWVFD